MAPQAIDPAIKPEKSKFNSAIKNSDPLKDVMKNKLRINANANAINNVQKPYRNKCSTFNNSGWVYLL